MMGNHLKQSMSLDGQHYFNTLPPSLRCLYAVGGEGWDFGL